jgi:small GTP-binding protein
MPRPRKIILLGDFGVGKTSFGTRLAKGEFRESTLATLGVAHFNVSVRAADAGPLAPAVKLEVWDTAGQERYRSIDTLKLYLRGAAGAIVVADLTRAASFDAAVRVIEQLRGADLGCPADFPIALAANKSDLPSRKVAVEAVAAAAVDLRLVDARETSCKTGDGVLALARALVKALPPPVVPADTVELEQRSSKDACC